MNPIDNSYCNLPWKAGGRSRDGLDCAGLAQIWLNEQMGLNFTAPPSGEEPDAEKLLGVDLGRDGCPSRPLTRGDCVFFRPQNKDRVCHVAIYLGNERYLHIVRGYPSRIDVGTRLMERIGLRVAGAIPAAEVERLCLALKDPALGTPDVWVTVALIALSIALSAASAFLLRPKLGQTRPQTGRYSFDALTTQTSAELPLAEVLGALTIAGNSPFQSMLDKSYTLVDATGQKANKIVVLCSGPVDGFDETGVLSTINGTLYNNAHFYTSTTSTSQGFKIGPAQTAAEAIDGTIPVTTSLNDTNRPSFTFYNGAHDITVPVDIRASYDRDFPIYGFSGASYMAFRLIDSSKFSGFNLNTTVTGRLCRTFDQNGFITNTITSESLTGADGTKVRFKLAFTEVKAVTGLTVNGTAYSEITASANTGNVFYVNHLKGYVEFITAPAASATILVSYTYHPRVWTSNPAAHLVYLLTEPTRGKGFPDNKIHWPSANALQNYCAQPITWINDTGSHTGPRYSCNYVIDSRKPIQDHITAILDSCYGYLFLSGGQFHVKARAADTAVYDFNSLNILAGSFSSEKIDRSSRANRVHVFFRSTTTYNVESEIIRDDPNDQRARADRQGDNGIVEQTLHLPAIDDQAQAERYAEQILRENVATRWTCELTTNIQGLALQPGDVITVTHPSQPTWLQKLFRLEELNYDANDQLVLKCSEYFDGSYI